MRAPLRDSGAALGRTFVMRAINGSVVGGLATVLVAAAAASTPPPSHHSIRVSIDGRSIARRFPPGPSISFRYPANWHVTRHRLDDVLDPHTLFAVTTYRLPGGRVDDCDGTRARGRPADGAFVLVKEVLDGASLRRSLPRLPRRPRRFRLPTRGGAFCLAPPSVVYQFRVGKRAFYVFISVGCRASAHTRAAVTTLLDGMRIARYVTNVTTCTSYGGSRDTAGRRSRSPWLAAASPAARTCDLAHVRARRATYAAA